MDPSPTRVSRVPFYWPFKDRFYGWAVVWTSVLVSFAQVPMYGPVLSVFMKPIGDDTGWSRGELSIAFTAGSLLGSMLSSIVGRYLDKYGARVSVVVAGMVVSAVLLGLALMQEVWQFWVLFGAGRAAAISGINLGTSVAVANWFIKKRGRTVSLLGVGLRTGQSLYPLFITPIILALSWRHAYGFLAILSLLLIVLPGWLFLRRRPEDMGLLPDGDAPDDVPARQEQVSARAGHAPTDVSWTLQEARRTLAFWMLVVATMVVVFAQTAVNLHAAASFEDRGIAEGFGGVFVFIFAGTAAASAFAWGAVMDRFHVRTGTIAATVLSGASMLAILFADNIPMAVLFAVLFGLGTGGWTVAQTLLFANYFGRAHLGSIRGSAQLISGPVGAAGPLLAGYIHNFTGSYTISFQVFFLSFALVVVALLLARQPKRA